MPKKQRRNRDFSRSRSAHGEICTAVDALCLDDGPHKFHSDENPLLPFAGTAAQILPDGVAFYESATGCRDWCTGPKRRSGNTIRNSPAPDTEAVVSGWK
jgi:hypothetical protein